MAANSKIAWTDHTFNPVWGCTKVSPGCDNCYAEKMSNRFGKWWGLGNARREFGDKHWAEPLKWNRKAEKSAKRTKVFCSSMADVFDKDWPEGVRERLWALIRATPHLDWQIVTKRIGNARKMLPADWGDGYPNVWLIITVVDQVEYDRDAPKLFGIAAKIHGISYEPALGPLVLPPTFIAPLPDWIICGAESGPGRRPFDIAWARGLSVQCNAVRVPFFLKQIPGGTGRKGVIETPELDGRQWTQSPGDAS